MPLNRKQKRLLLLALVAAALVLLAASLDGVRFQAGMPFPGGESAPGATAQTTGTAPTPTAGFAWSLVQLIAALGFAAGLVYLVYSLVKWAGTRRIALTLLGLAVLLAVLMIVPGYLAGSSVPPGGAAEIYLPPVSTEVATTPLGEPPRGLTGLVAAGLGLLLVAAAGWMILQARRIPPDDALARQAEAALRSIRAGEELSSVILRCYRQMGQALQAAAEIERPGGMTAREFEALLEDYGVPAGPIGELTRLFELARYSRQPLGAAEEQAALASLTAITQYCREAKARPAG